MPDPNVMLVLRCGTDGNWNFVQTQETQPGDPVYAHVKTTKDDKIVLTKTFPCQGVEWTPESLQTAFYGCSFNVWEKAISASKDWV